MIKAIARLRELASKPDLNKIVTIGKLKGTVTGLFGSHGDYVEVSLKFPSKEKLQEEDLNKIVSYFGKLYKDRKPYCMFKGGFTYVKVLVTDKSYKFNIDDSSTNYQEI